LRSSKSNLVFPAILVSHAVKAINFQNKDYSEPKDKIKTSKDPKKKETVHNELIKDIDETQVDLIDHTKNQNEYKYDDSSEDDYNYKEDNDNNNTAQDQY